MNIDMQAYDCMSAFMFEPSMDLLPSISLKSDFFFYLSSADLSPLDEF